MIRKNILNERQSPRGERGADKVVRIIIDALVNEIDNCPVDKDGKFGMGNTYRLPDAIEKAMEEFDDMCNEIECWEPVPWEGLIYAIDEKRALDKDEEYEKFEYRNSDGTIEFEYRDRRFYEFGVFVRRTRRSRGEKGYFCFRGQLKKGLTPPPPKTVGGWIGRRNDD